MDHQHIQARNDGNRSIRRLARPSACLFVLSLLWVTTGSANSDGISGVSGIDAGVPCRGCHTGGTAPAVAFAGPGEMAPGARAAFSFTVASGAALQTAAGVDIAASDGVLGVVDGQGTRLLDGDITHAVPKANDANGEVSFTFIWEAPLNAGTYTLFGAGNSVDLDGRRGGDAAAAATYDVVVAGDPVTPTPTPTPAHEGTPTPTPTATATPTEAAGVCAGDCNGDDAVTVDEIINMVAIALGTAPADACLAGDAGVVDGTITVDEILTAVNHALTGCPATAPNRTVRPGESIQAAVDAAAPGETIEVLPGVYTEQHGGAAAVRVTKPLRLIARRLSAGDTVRIVPGPGQRDGIFVAPTNEDEPAIDGVEITGFTVEGFPRHGIWLRRVVNFVIEENETGNNLETGIFPTLSTNGLVKNNVAYGTLDAALWIESSENVRVIGNEVYHNPNGIEVTVSKDVLVEGNDVHDNVVGIHLNHPTTAGLPPSDWPPPPFGPVSIVGNHVYDNNFPNPVSGGIVGQLPSGGGILILGVDDAEIRGNLVEGNNFFGIAAINYCLVVDGTEFSCQIQPPLGDNPAPNYIRLIDNTSRGNGTAPSPGPFAGFAVDLGVLGGANNCASGNVAPNTLLIPQLPPCTSS